MQGRAFMKLVHPSLPVLFSCLLFYSNQRENWPSSSSSSSSSVERLRREKKRRKKNERIESMGLMSFVGRLFFVSFFLFTAWQEFNAFGFDGGPAAKDFRPKYNRLMNHVNHRLGVHVPGIEIKHIVAANIALKGIGGILFVFGSSFGAYLLLLQLTFRTPILFDFYNYDIKNPHFFQLLVKFTQCMALFGALLFFLDMKNAIPIKQSKKKAPKAKTV